MSEEIALAAGDITYWKTRAIQSERREHVALACLDELHLLRELADDLTRWRESGGDIRDLTYIFETMDRYEQMKGDQT